MSESDMRGTVVKLLKDRDAVAIENPVYPGTPDVNYIDGWIELKWLRAFPAKPETPVTLDHYTPQQKLWIRRRCLKGGKAWLLIQCKKEWFLFTHPEHMNVGKLTKAELINTAYRYTSEGMTKEKLESWIQHYQKQKF